MKADAIKKAFCVLSDNKPCLTQECFVENMKRLDISFFNEFDFKTSDYESRCGELFREFELQLKSNKIRRYIEPNLNNSERKLSNNDDGLTQEDVL